MDTKETLGPAETIIQSLLAYSDHIYHGRPGVVVPDARSTTGVRWDPVTHKEGEDGVKTVLRLTRNGKKTIRTAIGTMNGDNRVKNAGADVGLYRKSGLFPEVALWFYKQIAEVWTLDNEFAARWASYAFRQEHRDLKVMLAAFMLVQSRKGDPVMDGGERLFDDEDYRDVGEAMVLLLEKGNDLNPKHLLRIYDVLNLPEIAKINHELGFGKSAKRPFLGRWPKAIEKYLRYREENPKLLEGLVNKAAFGNTVKTLARRIGYKPTSDKFFATLRWKQKQAEDGRREMAIGKAVKAAESWDHLDEAGVCELIEKSKPGWKRIVGLLPAKIGVTRAVMAATIESGGLSDKDLIILTPTIEDLGLFKVQEIKARHAAALAKASDMRAANIARNVRSKDLKEEMETGADKAAQKAAEEVIKNLRLYIVIDRSASMQGALEKAKPLIAKFIQAIPAERLHVSTFNTIGKVITFKHHSTAGVEAAFRGVNAGGGTVHAEGVRVLAQFPPAADEDSLMIFIGDEGERRHFAEAVEASGLRPLAFGLLATVGPRWGRGQAIRDTAARLDIPCFEIDDRTFDGDPYAIPRTIRNLIAATPVGVTTGRRVAPRVTLVGQILETEILQKPNWA